MWLAFVFPLSGLGLQYNRLVGQDFEEGGLAGVGKGDPLPAYPVFSVFQAFYLVYIDKVGTVGAAEMVEGQLTFQGLEGHQGHERVAIGLVDVDVIAVGFYKKDIVHWHLCHDQVHFHGDEGRSFRAFLPFAKAFNFS